MLQDYDKEKMKELIKNPLFREANAALVHQLEKQLREDEAERKIRAYLQDNPGVSYAKLVTETNVDPKIVELLIEEKRIDVVLTSKDRDELEELQQEVLRDLKKVGQSLSDKKYSREKLRESREAEKPQIKGSGMYSKKEKL